MRKLLVGILFCVPLYADATLITTSIGTYDVSTIFTTFPSSSSLLQSQVWWGNNTLAAEFAALGATSLGLPDTVYGPFFATSVADDFAYGKAWAPFAGQVLDVQVQSIYSAYFAVATKATNVPEPGTLSLLGAGLLGLLRLRRRIA